MAVPRTARKADISLALGSGQIMCSLHVIRRPLRSTRACAIEHVVRSASAMVERAARVLCAAAALGFASLALGHGHDCGLYSAECPLADLATRVAGAPLPDLGDGLPAASPVSRRVRTAAEAARPAPIFSASGC